MRAIDMTGQVCGKLTVLSKAPRTYMPSGQAHAVHWNCVCECGNEVRVSGAYLRNGHTTSCGCARSEKFEDLTGRTFYALTPTECVSKGPVQTMWRCVCECGNEIVVRASSLKNGHTKSCGCRKKQLRKPDMVGKTFGRLTVVSRGNDFIETSGLRAIRWTCVCVCGRETLVRGSDLRGGVVKSCGCYRAEMMNLAPMSHGENWIAAYLKSQGHAFTQQQVFPDLISPKGSLLLYDFFVNDAILIECHGSQHYEVNPYFGGQVQFDLQQEHDRIKRDYAKAKGLPLIELRYRGSKFGPMDLLGPLHHELNTLLRDKDA